MAREFEREVVRIVQDILDAEIVETPAWLVRPGRSECGTEWDRVCAIYNELTGLALPETMRTVEWRKVDAVFAIKGCRPRILEVDEDQHFNCFRAMTLRHYLSSHPLAFDGEEWFKRSEAKQSLERGGFAKPRPPLFPGSNGRHRQRAFRDALCDLIPPIHGYAPTLRIADFEAKSWIAGTTAISKMQLLLESRLAENLGEIRQPGE